jgi:hypothetical protein
MMKNLSIGFVGNFYKTVVFETITKNIPIDKKNVYWFVTKESQYSYLCTQFPKENILLIDCRRIKADNEPIGDFKINELVFGDRVWKYEKEKGIKYLTNIQQPIYDFIKNNHISCVFGEATWAHELLIHRICKNKQELSCKYYSHSVVRIPNGRFIFFNDEKQTEIIERKYNVEVINTTLTIEKPSYLFVNDKIIAYKISGKGLLNRIKRFITNENIEKTDPNVLRGFLRIITATQEVLNQISYKFLKRVDFNSVKNKKYILFGFHKQPEASIDVCGRYFENQFENVVNLWRQLPPDWYLVIKEHSNAIGDRNFHFLRRLSKYPRVVLMHEKEDSHLLIRHAQLVATNTGTMALEAALMNIPAITFSQVFFNKINYCRHCSWTDLEKYNSITDLINEIRVSPDNTEEYTQYIMKNSFEGVLRDVITTPEVLSPENIKQLSKAIMEVSMFSAV